MDYFVTKVMEDIDADDFHRLTGAPIDVSKTFVLAGNGNLKRALKLYFDNAGCAKDVLMFHSEAEIMNRQQLPVRSRQIEDVPEDDDYTTRYVKSTIDLFHPSSDSKKEKRKANYRRKMDATKTRNKSPGLQNNTHIVIDNEDNKGYDSNLLNTDIDIVLNNATTGSSSSATTPTPSKMVTPKRENKSKKTLTPSQKRALEFRKEATILFDQHGDDLI